MIGDGECTWWPDVWFGISITPCCVEHDASPIDVRAALDLGVCVYRTLALSQMEAAGLVLGSVMFAGCSAWAVLRMLRTGA